MTDSLLPRPRTARRPFLVFLAVGCALATCLAAQAPETRGAGARGPSEPLRPNLVEQVAGTIVPGRYLVQVRTETAVRRSGLSQSLRELRRAHRAHRAHDAGLGDGSAVRAPAPLLEPGTFRRQVVRGAAFQAARQQTRGSLVHILDELERHLGRPLPPRRSFDVTFAGFELELTAEEAQRLTEHPLVALVEPVPRRPLQSDVGPDVVSAPDVWTGTVTGMPTRGAGILVGVIDSGIEPLHQSFADVPGVMNPLGSGNYLGVCDDGHPDYDPAFPCSDKLVGAYDLTDETEDYVEGPDDGALYSSHGSHVASIAIGNEIDAGFGVNPMVPHMRGIAPLASVVAYDACVAQGFVELCDGAAILAAIDQAVADGVDVLNISIKGATAPWSNSESLALLDAFEAGVLTAASAGNDPGVATVTRLEPWVLNVGATTHDRVDYLAVLSPSGGDAVKRPALFGARGMGSSVPTGEIVLASDIPPGDNGSCDKPFADDSLLGQIVYCLQGGMAPLNVTANKADALANSGAVAVLSYSPYPAYPLFPSDLPYFLIPAAIRTDFEDWLAEPAATAPAASLTTASLIRDTSYADIVMHFSSRGPATGFDLLKPDLVAPGANIMGAADSEYLVTVPVQGGTIAGIRYNSGTSMATPAVAGAAALLREMHPSLSPAEVQSVLETTADPGDLTNCTNAGGIWVPPCSIPLEPADLFDFGAGRLDVTAAAKAGLAFDVTRDEFFAANPDCDPGGLGPFPCDPAGPSQLNLPSMAKVDCGAGCAFARRASSIATGSVGWTAAFTGPRGTAAPLGVEAHVVPPVWALDPAADQPFVVGVYATDPGVVDEWQQLVLELTPDDAGVSTARLPIVVMPTVQPASSELEVTAQVLTGPLGPGDPVRFEVRVTNLGTVPAVGVEVTADVLGGLDGVLWDCTPTARNWCGSGSGALFDLAAILPGEDVVYVFEGSAQDPLPDPVQFDVSISAPSGLDDPSAANNTATVFASTILFSDGFESGDTQAWI